MSPLLAAAALALSASPHPARTFAVAPGSVLAFRLVHKFHTVEGVSKAVEGRARLLPDGGVQAMVRARVDSFDSGNGNRDADMREVMEAARFPLVTVKAAGKLLEVASYPATVELTLRGEITFHGRTESIEVPVKIRFETPERAQVESTFGLSLEAFEVQRPSLLFVKVDDRLDVTASLTLEEER
jgi:hypothetical protein